MIKTCRNGTNKSWKSVDPLNMAAFKAINYCSRFVWRSCFTFHVFHTVLYGPMDLDDLESLAGMSRTK
ncbi:hypothetical protein RSAG8_13712, partial [Rhizoctonia solani AG-8 WAC10335]